MKSLIFVILLFFSVSCAAQEEPEQMFYGTEDLKTFREGRDREFHSKEESPLKEEDFPLFKGLDYFPDDKGFRFKANFRRTADEKYFEMPTSSGKRKKFVKYGV